MQVSKFKSLIRTVIREELDFYFDKLQKQLNETRSQSKEEIIEEDRQVSSKAPKLKSKFMQAIAEGFDEDELSNFENSTSAIPSILDENNIKSLKNAKQGSVRSVSNALTRDYSKLLQRVDQIKSKKL